jgi:hypothetical protein
MSGAIYYLEQDLNQTPAPGSPCSGQASPVTCATAVAGLNGLPPDNNPTNLAVTSNSAGGFAGGPFVTVSVINPHPPNVIAKLLGITPSTHATATASLVGPGQANGNVVPIGININAANQWKSGDQLTLLFDKANTTNGNFFTLLKNNFCDQNGAPGLKSCIANGSCGPVADPNCAATVGSVIFKDDGSNWNGGNDPTQCDTNGNHSCQAWFANLPRTLYVPVYNNTTGDTLVGFAMVTAQACTSPPGQNNAQYICLTFLGKQVPVSSGPPGQFFGTGNAALTS